MLIEEKIVRHWIDNFYGYGSWQARTWFIGYEESGGDLPEEVAEKINYFYQAHPASNEGALCDIRELNRRMTVKFEGPHLRSYTNLYEYWFGTSAIQNNLWKNLSAFKHGFRNEPIPDLLEYQKHIFTSASMLNESLIRLFPLPSPHNHAWYYSWLDLPNLGFLKSRRAYEEHLYHHRIERILSNMRTYKPEVVLMYGMNNVNTLKKSIQDFFQGSKFKLIKSISQQIAQHHCAYLDGTTVVITTQIPTLRHNRIETGFDWEEIGKRVKEKN